MLNHKGLQRFLQPDARMFGGGGTRMPGIAVGTSGGMDGKCVQLGDEFHQATGAAASHLRLRHGNLQQLILGEAPQFRAVVPAQRRRAGQAGVFDVGPTRWPSKQGNAQFGGSFGVAFLRIPAGAHQPRARDNAPKSFNLFGIQAGELYKEDIERRQQVRGGLEGFEACPSSQHVQATLILVAFGQDQAGPNQSDARGSRAPGFYVQARVKLVGGELDELADRLASVEKHLDLV